MNRRMPSTSPPANSYTWNASHKFIVIGAPKTLRMFGYQEFTSEAGQVGLGRHCCAGI